MTRKDQADTSPQDARQAAALHDARQAVPVLVLLEHETDKDVQDQGFYQAGCQPIYVTSFAEANAGLDQVKPEIVFVPLTLNGKSCLPFLHQCTAHDAAPHVVVIASNAQINDAAEAMHLGAFDCLFQPYNSSRLAQVIQGSLTARGTPAPAPAPVVKSTEMVPLPYPVTLQPASNSSTHPKPVATSPSSRARKPAPHGSPRAQIIGHHPDFTAALTMLDKVATSTAPVFLQGEIGTGKELFARALHALSGRPTDRFVVVDCAALRPDTIASEMFGHVKGALPGLAQDKTGAAVLADGGTLYLDEIANLDPKAQQQLVRFLRSGQVHPLGADDSQQVDVRIVSASSQDPMALVTSGDLQKDLYYQLHVAPITLPPLRERGDDLTLLATHFLKELSRNEGRAFGGFAQDALAKLKNHPWLGNVHELKNTLWTAVLQHDGPLLTAEMLPPSLGQSFASSGGSAPNALAPWLGRSLAEIEQMVIEETIRAHGDSIPKAARVLGVSPSTIYRKRETWQA